ncbi:hypothetical protein D3C78_1843380 [compost metagenome]
MPKSTTVITRASTPHFTYKVSIYFDLTILNIFVGQVVKRVIVLGGVVRADTWSSLNLLEGLFTCKTAITNTSSFSNCYKHTTIQ